LRGLLGDEASLSSPTVARVKEKWHAELAVWQTRRLEALQAVYLWVEGIYVKAGLEKDKAALLVAALSDGRKVVLAVTPGHRESTASWAAVLRDLRDRGLRAPRLSIGDGHLGIWSAVRQVYPDAEEQRSSGAGITGSSMSSISFPRGSRGRPKRGCVRSHMPPRAGKRSSGATSLCTGVSRRATRTRRNAWKRIGIDWWSSAGFHSRTATSADDESRGVALCRSAITNRCGEAFRLVKNATAVIWKMLLVAEQAFRRVKHPELMPVVYRGGMFVDGMLVNKEVAA
jgi:hypothetical protein